MKKTKPQRFLIPDSEIPKLFEQAFGRKMTGYDLCTNGYRRFFEACLVWCAKELEVANDRTK